MLAKTDAKVNSASCYKRWIRRRITDWVP